MRKPRELGQPKVCLEIIGEMGEKLEVSKGKNIENMYVKDLNK